MKPAKAAPAALQKLQVTNQDGSRSEIEGVVVGPAWAATPICWGNVQRGAPRWTITHIPTGLGVGSRFRGSKRDAVRVAREVAARWPALDTTDGAAMAALSAFLTAALPVKRAKVQS